MCHALLLWGDMLDAGVCAISAVLCTGLVMHCELIREEWRVSRVQRCQHRAELCVHSQFSLSSIQGSGAAHEVVCARGALWAAQNVQTQQVSEFGDV